uniref:Uncharacterized protein n=1 Tax=Triticum urartu TaxID=4572 RepID=A0A8R7R1T3_TRIUA
GGGRGVGVGGGGGGRQRRVELGEHALDPMGEVGGVVVHGVRGEVGAEVVVGGGASAHAAHPHGHLELLQPLLHVRHVGRTQ